MTHFTQDFAVCDAAIIAALGDDIRFKPPYDAIGGGLLTGVNFVELQYR